MPDFKEMYLTLFRETTKAISTLQRAQQQMEELYMANNSANHLVVLDPDRMSGKDGKEQLPQE